MDTIELKDVVVDSRIRTDLGDIDGLSNSIKQYGLIQPIVLGRNWDQDGSIRLIAGGRRLTALKRLGIKVLTHVTPEKRGEFIWDFEQGSGGDAVLRFRALELEENLRRKQLDWREELLGKQKLLELMQEIYGKAKGGGPTSSTSSKPGFGVNKLASMLGESPATTSQDLKVAALLTQVPGLRSCKTKSEVLTKMAIATTVVGMQQSKSEKPNGNESKLWTLYEEDFRTGAAKLASESVDLVWTDLPYGADVGQMSGQQATSLAGFDDSFDTAVGLLKDVAEHSYRVLRNDRYAVFCFGFVIYRPLVEALRLAGFRVNLVPFVWVKNTKSGENPTTRYCNGYEPLLVAEKGAPVFIRPGQSNVATIPTVGDKLQSVQKPVELVKRFLTDMVASGATVVDWCAGTGSTGVAATETKVNSILFERDPSMALIARTRLEALR